ncbi:hypothetical protein EVAR_35392_1 [Eumeta japonica]|uniref:Uncharacterized protein n=1 Tax=Eumeta variegata TaxID=151549 RepID=A0A4C1XEI3_EUMVA|nr:hypothetical protein EVAR_35392_1 [Eumeta japonica]
MRSRWKLADPVNRIVGVAMLAVALPGYIYSLFIAKCTVWRRIVTLYNGPCLQQSDFYLDLSSIIGNEKEELAVKRSQVAIRGGSSRPSGRETGEDLRSDASS